MNRKYPKQNRPSGHEDEPNSHGEPNIASHRKEVAAYFFGIGAAITLTIASALFSSNRAAAIFWFWVTGVLSVTGGCFFWSAKERHSAIKVLWWTGFVAISLGCVIWAWTQQPSEEATKPGAVISAPAPAEGQSTAGPDLTPSFAPTTFNQFVFSPKQIVEKLKSAKSSSEEEGFKAGFVGLPVDWTLSFSSASMWGIGGKKYWSVILTSGPVLESPPVALTVPFDGNERLSLTDKNQQFRVRGSISEATRSLIFLTDQVTLEPVSK